MHCVAYLQNWGVKLTNDLGNVSIFADDDVGGNVILKVGDGLKLSVHWKVANGLIPMVYAACRAAEDEEKTCGK
jgi:hypothetical protein